MRHVCRIFLSLSINWIFNSYGFKVFEFPTSLEENSKVSIQNKVPTPEEFTLCMDFYSHLAIKARLLKSGDTEDIEIYLNEGGGYIYVQVAGIWYLAVPESPPWVDSLEWRSLCVSFNSKNQAVTIAFRSRIIVSEENIFPNRKLSDNFLNDLTLGEKVNLFYFTGYITRVNIWSKVLDDATLENITTCGSSNFEESPDILHWDNVKTKIEGGIIEKNVLQNT